MNGALSWAGKHPVLLGVGVFVVGAFLLLILRRPTVVDNGMSAFYAAQSASNAAGAQAQAVQAQVAGATAIAKIAADRDVHLGDTAAAYNAQVTTVQAQRDIDLANTNAAVLMEAEHTRQQAQKQQFFMGVGVQQIMGAIAPFIMNSPNGPAILLGMSQSATKYQPAH